MSRVSIICFRFLTVLSLTVALISIGFAHRSVQAEPSPELADFLAMGGSLSDLCGLPSGEGPSPLTDCEACRIVDNLMSTPGCNSTGISELQKTRTFAFVAKRLAQSRGLDPARLTRAPPLA